MRDARTDVAVFGTRGLTAARMAAEEDFAERAADQVAMWCWRA